MQVLDNLPHTVRGVGRELHGSHEPSEPISSHAYGDLEQQRKRDRVVVLLGFVVVVSHDFIDIAGVLTIDETLIRALYPDHGDLTAK